MYLTTEAIVLQLYPYKDNSAIVKLYTQQSGLISCWAASVHKKTSKTRASLLQPLSLIKAEISHKENNNLVQLKEAEQTIHTPGIALNIEKSSIAIFLAELLLNVLKESSHDEWLFTFIKDSILLLDATKEKCANFHLLFLVRLADHLGLLPKDNHSADMPYFNLEEGIFQRSVPMHPFFLSPVESEWLNKLSALPLERFYEPVIPSNDRKQLLHGLIKYFEIHLAMQPLKSHLVLEEVF